MNKKCFSSHNKRIEDIINWFAREDKVLVALSGGVDSALVAYAAYHSVGTNSLAVTADYKTLAEEELESAKRVAREIGIPHRIIEYNELENPEFVKNDSLRCYHCRTELSTHLNALAKENDSNLIVDGTNSDDIEEYRPGIAALHKNNVKSPLAELEFTKKEVRDTAKFVGISIYDKPSNSCLASRIPWGKAVTAEKLARIEYGEKMVRNMFGITQVRIRDIGGLAKIEVFQEDIHLLTTNNNRFNKLRSALIKVGFSEATVDKEGYKPGKANVVIQ